MNSMKKNMIVLAVLAALCVPAAFWVFDLSNNKGKSESIRRLDFFSIAKVTSLEMVKQGFLSRIEKKDDAWRITAPVNAKADAKVVNKTLHTLGKTKLKNCYVDGNVKNPSLESVGLDVPDSSIAIFTGKKKLQLKIDIGDVNSFDNSVYVLLHRGEKTEFCTVLSKLKKTDLKVAHDFYDRTLLGTLKKDIVALSIRSQLNDAKEIVRLKRRETSASDKNIFDLEVPVVGRADHDLWVHIFSALGDANLDIVSFDKKQIQFGLLNPQLEVSFRKRTQPEKEITLAFSHRQPADERGFDFTYVTRSDENWVGVVHAEVAERLFLKNVSLLSRQLLDVDPQKVHRVVLQTQAEKIEVLLTEGEFAKSAKWKMLQPLQAEVPAHRMTQIIFSMGRLLGKSRVPPLANESILEQRNRLGLGENEGILLAFYDDKQVLLGKLRFSFTNLKLKEGEQPLGIAYALNELQEGASVIEIDASRYGIFPTDAEELLLP